MAGLAIILFWIVVGVVAPLISPYLPNKSVGPRLAPPCGLYPFGTDALGRDVMSRLIWGTRMALTLGPAATFIGVFSGLCVGLITGYVGGILDMIIMRLCDIILSFPTTLLYMLIIATVGPSPLIVVISIGAGAMPSVGRITRSLVMEERTQDYVNAARLRGERRWYILFREILPNITAPIVADACIRLGYAIMAIGGLGFLGLLKPAVPEWGTMINEGRTWILYRPLMVIVPAFALSSLVIALNLLSDGLREAAQRR